MGADPGTYRKYVGSVVVCWIEKVHKSYIRMRERVSLRHKSYIRMRERVSLRERERERECCGPLNIPRNMSFSNFSKKVLFVF